MYKIEITKKFKQSMKKVQKSGINTQIIYDVINIIAKGEPLPEKYSNHPLKGRYKGFYDCHILPDLVLIYRIEKERLILLLFDIGTHSNLFK